MLNQGGNHIAQSCIGKPLIESIKINRSRNTATITYIIFTPKRRVLKTLVVFVMNFFFRNKRNEAKLKKLINIQ